MHQCFFVAKMRPNPHHACETTTVDEMRAVAVPITEADAEEEAPRYSTGIPGFNRCLGGGVTKGSVTLITGDPGCGKSTLLMEAAYRMACAGARVVYISGEETFAQVSGRAAGMGCLHPNILLMYEPNGDVAFAEAERLRPHVVIVDSVQRLAVSWERQANGDIRRVRGAAGTEAQVKAVMHRAIDLAKRSGFDPVVFVVGHVIKDGSAAGPKAIEHDGDARLHFLIDPTNTRSLRSGKNRYGPTGEVATFEFRGKNMVELTPGQAAMMRPADLPGVVSFPSAHLVRPYMVEVHAAVIALKGDKTLPLLRCTGVSGDKLREILELVGEAGIELPRKTIRLKVQRAMDQNVNDPAVDLALVAAILSGVESATISRCAVFGELSPDGSIMPDANMTRRLSILREGAFVEVVGPPMREPPPDLRYHAVADLEELHAWVRSRSLLVDTAHRPMPAMPGAAIPSAG